ncbi:purine-cytosine permease family protein [Microbacterium sp. NPDC058345]|uniref:purine-cytosine permease family protein n=1 Tax=Microbacterium sp. NPDC058345 TaxID=3346455 RepID=UPI0036617FB4
MAQDAVVDDFATRIETRGIDLIGDAQRHGRARDLFAVWAAPNVSILNFTIGASLILLGLEIWQAIAVILVSSTLWIFPGIVAASGPAAGTSGSVITRAIYGVIGNRLIVALVGWLIGSVYLALNWLGSSFLGADLVGRLGMGDALWTPIVVTLVISAVTVLVAVYGHGLILKTYGVVSLVLVVIFVVVAAFALPHADFSYVNPEPLDGVALWSSLTIGFTLLASSPLSYINSPDLARYLPRSTRPSHIAAATALGGAIPNILFTAIGVLVATGVGAAIQTDGIEKALIGILPGWLGPVLVIGVVVNTISLNAMTTYTSSMALQAIGLPIRRVPAAVVVGVIGTALTIVLVLSTSLLGAVNLILQFVVIVSAPTMTVFVVDALLRRNRYDGVELFDETRTSRFWYTGGWSVPGIAAVLLGAVITALCLTTEVWTGPIAVALGYVDLSVPLGILTTAVTYLGLSRTRFAGERTERAEQTVRMERTPEGELR